MVPKSESIPWWIVYVALAQPDLRLILHYEKMTGDEVLLKQVLGMSRKLLKTAVRFDPKLPTSRDKVTFRIGDVINNDQQLFSCSPRCLVLKQLWLFHPKCIQSLDRRSIGIFEAVILRKAQSLSE